MSSFDEQLSYDDHTSRRKQDDFWEQKAPEKTLGSLASFALLVNNMVGPAMMGIPFLFVRAGIIPVVCSVGVAWICSSLVGTLLCDTIAGILGNSKFTQNVTFASACKTIIGGRWYLLAEGLFLLSCMIQAFAGLIETAHAMDGFLAYFLLGRTFALQLLPVPELIEWTPSECRGVNLGDSTLHEAYEPSDCTPFYDDGPLLITLGFVLTTAIFMPLGLALLKETMVMQFISFFCLLLSLSQFEWEFLSRGLLSHVPWIGTDFTSLAGVILFNYTITLTMPSWLSEKRPEVGVNRTIWGATTLVSLLYISFGLLAAMAFEGVTDEMLTILCSSKAHFFTRIYGALFGVIIIGGGVPVFCVVLRTTLSTNTSMNPKSALFWGAIFPYAASWVLYQGSLLMTVLNWTGLVVNGVVAFILPLVLTACALKNANRSTTPKPRPLGYLPLIPTPTTSHHGGYSSVHDSTDRGGVGEPPDSDPGPAKKSGAVDPLPHWLEPYRSLLVRAMIALFAVAIVVSLFIKVLPPTGIEDVDVDQQK